MPNMGNIPCRRKCLMLISFNINCTLNCLKSSLVSLFNGISTFEGYLMPKPFSKKNSSGAI